MPICPECGSLMEEMGNSLRCEECGYVAPMYGDGEEDGDGDLAD